MGQAHNRAYRNGVLLGEGFEISEISGYLEQADVIVWIDICTPDKAQLDELADELKLHELAVEDALGPHQRPKLDFYDTHLFLTCHALSVDLEVGQLNQIEIDAFVNSRWFITVRKDERFSVLPVIQRCENSPHLLANGVGALLYGLLDTVIDGYFNTASVFDDYYDEVSEGLFSDTPLDPSEQRRWFHMRRALVHFHRLVVPMREAISALMRREHDAITDAMYPYFQDVYDHILRVAESADALRDLVATIVETNLSLRDFRQNQIMKKVTSWAAIIAVPTLITGFYGMNVPYPGFAREWGFETSIALMVILVVILWVQFRRHDWILLLTQPLVLSPCHRSCQFAASLLVIMRTLP